MNFLNQNNKGGPAWWQTSGQHIPTGMWSPPAVNNNNTGVVSGTENLGNFSPYNKPVSGNINQSSFNNTGQSNNIQSLLQALMKMLGGGR